MGASGPDPGLSLLLTSAGGPQVPTEAWEPGTRVHGRPAPSPQVSDSQPQQQKRGRSATVSLQGTCVCSFRAPAPSMPGLAAAHGFPAKSPTLL